MKGLAEQMVTSEFVTNKVFDQLAPNYTLSQREDQFLETQRIVRWCYQ